MLQLAGYGYILFWLIFISFLQFQFSYSGKFHTTGTLLFTLYKATLCFVHKYTSYYKNTLCICFNCFITEEICLNKAFRPSCQSNEVILMETALYGRMQIGQCVKNNHGHIGCHNDAMASFDAACSGKQSCDVEITNDLWRDVTGACMAAIAGYADVTYSCKEGKVLLLQSLLT